MRRATWCDAEEDMYYPWAWYEEASVRRPRTRPPAPQPMLLPTPRLRPSYSTPLSYPDDYHPVKPRRRRRSTRSVHPTRWRCQSDVWSVDDDDDEKEGLEEVSNTTTAMITRSPPLQALPPPLQRPTTTTAHYRRLSPPPSPPRSPPRPRRPRHPMKQQQPRPRSMETPSTRPASQPRVPRKPLPSVMDSEMARSLQDLRISPLPRRPPSLELRSPLSSSSSSLSLTTKTPQQGLPPPPPPPKHQHPLPPIQTQSQTQLPRPHKLSRVHSARPYDQSQQNGLGEKSLVEEDAVSPVQSSGASVTQPTFWNPRNEPAEGSPIRRTFSKRLRGLLQPQRSRIEGASSETHAIDRAWSVSRAATPLAPMNRLKPDPFRILGYARQKRRSLEFFFFFWGGRRRWLRENPDG